MFAVAFAIEDPKVKVDLTSYFVKRPPGVLHCTTKFTEFGKAPGAEEYAQQEVSTMAPAFPCWSLPSPSLLGIHARREWAGGGSFTLSNEANCRESKPV